MHAAVEYQASDEVIALLTKRYAGATREMNHLKKLPVDIANENGASEYVLAELARGDSEARNSEVGILAWLWG